MVVGAEVEDAMAVGTGRLFTLSPEFVACGCCTYRICYLTHIYIHIERGRERERVGII